MSRALLIRAVGGLAVMLAAWWALRPLPGVTELLGVEGGADLRSSQQADEPAPDAPDETAMVALDESVFHAPLWLAPPPPPAPPPEPAKPAPLPPLKLQLLAIVRVPEAASDEARYRAMLYDPETDKIIEVAAGETIGDRTVVGVTQHEITLKDRAGTRTLSLRADAPRTSPGTSPGAGPGSAKGGGA
ncbi:MAG: hypothetical protein IT436_04170 [Phycisphaerales bacterium]|nr:hypothetical protein [Phycisphaerales bacterium]